MTTMIRSLSAVAKKELGRFATSRWPQFVLLLAGAFCVGDGAARAQSRAAALPPKSFMTKSTFYLPVKVDDRVRPNLKEIRLYVKDDAGKPWLLQDKVAPTQTYFTFRAPREGEYWFTVVTVDKTGRATPGDLRQEGPALIVVLDSQPPQVELRPLPPSSEGMCIHCVVHDANPDLAKTRFYYQTGDMMWRPLDPLPDRPDHFNIPTQAACTGMVCVEASDLAKNTVRKEFNLGNMNGNGSLLGQKPGQDAQSIKQTSFSNPKELSRTARPGSLDQVTPSGALAPQTPSPFPAEKIEDTTGPALTGPELAPAAAQVAMARKIQENGAQPSAGHPATPAAQPALTKPNHQVVGKNRVFLDYQIDNKGASGVGKVEVWLTPDQGQSWKKLSEDADRKSPAEVELPGEGIYGINLVVSNGRGFGGTPPSAGDAPEMTIEVDHTKPVAEITNIQPGTGTNAGCLLISWNATDKNLGAEPIDLLYATTPQGPWQPIARGLANDGQYRWTMPATSASEAYIRLLARDAAGNVTQVETPQPVTLDDQSRPRGHVTGVSTVASEGK